MILNKINLNSKDHNLNIFSREPVDDDIIIPNMKSKGLQVSRYLTLWPHMNSHTSSSPKLPRDQLSKKSVIPKWSYHPETIFGQTDIRKPAGY